MRDIKYWTFVTRAIVIAGVMLLRTGGKTPDSGKTDTMRDIRLL